MRTYLKLYLTKVPLSYNKVTYFIDKEGFLLDSDNFYITDEKGNQIKIEEGHLEALKKKDILNKKIDTTDKKEPS